MKYPNTKNVFMILIAIILVGAAFLFAEYRNKKEQRIYIKPAVSIENQENQMRNEPLNETDWKKILLANEAVGSTTIKDLTKKAESLSSSDILARDFFSRYMEMNQMGNATDKISQQELIDRVLQNPTLTANPKTYSFSDILINERSEPESIKKYINEIAVIYNKYSIVARNEAIIAKEAFDKGDMTILNELDPIIKSNRNILSALLKLSTPNATSRIHLNLINNTSAIVFMDENFKKSKNDPFAGVMATSLVLKNNENLIQIIKEIKRMMTTNNISYASSEAGSIFMEQKNI